MPSSKSSRKKKPSKQSDGAALLSSIDFSFSNIDTISGAWRELEKFLLLPFDLLAGKEEISRRSRAGFFAATGLFAVIGVLLAVFRYHLGGVEVFRYMVAWGLYPARFLYTIYYCLCIPLVAYRLFITGYCADGGSEWIAIILGLFVAILFFVCAVIFLFLVSLVDPA